MIAGAVVAGIPAHAGVAVNFREIGTDVIAAASGSLDLTGLTDDDTFFAQIGVRGDPAYFTLGAEGDGSSNAEGYNGITGPAQSGTGGLVAPTSSSGDIIGVNAFFFGDLFVNRDYVSGARITARTSFAGQTFASLGLTPGTYVFSWPADTITLNIGAGAVPEPITWAMLMAGFGIIGVTMRRGGRQAASRASLPVRTSMASNRSVVFGRIEM